MQESRKPTPQEIESIQRKVNIVLGVSGQKDEQLNVLVHALAKLVAVQGVEMASVVSALCETYLHYMDLMAKEREDDEDDY